MAPHRDVTHAVQVAHVPPVCTTFVSRIADHSRRDEPNDHGGVRMERGQVEVDVLGAKWHRSRTGVPPSPSRNPRMRHAVCLSGASRPFRIRIDVCGSTLSLCLTFSYHTTEKMKHRVYCVQDKCVGTRAHSRTLIHRDISVYQRKQMSPSVRRW